MEKEIEDEFKEIYATMLSLSENQNEILSLIASLEKEQLLLVKRQKRILSLIERLK